MFPQDTDQPLAVAEACLTVAQQYLNASEHLLRLESILIEHITGQEKNTADLSIADVIQFMTRPFYDSSQDFDKSPVQRFLDEHRLATKNAFFDNVSGGKSIDFTSDAYDAINALSGEIEKLKGVWIEYTLGSPVQAAEIDRCDNIIEALKNPNIIFWSMYYAPEYNDPEKLAQDIKIFPPRAVLQQLISIYAIRAKIDILGADVLAIVVSHIDFSDKPKVKNEMLFSKRLKNSLQSFSDCLHKEWPSISILVTESSIRTFGDYLANKIEKVKTLFETAKNPQAERTPGDILAQAIQTLETARAINDTTVLSRSSPPEPPSSHDDTLSNAAKKYGGSFLDRFTIFGR